MDETELDVRLNKLTHPRVTVQSIEGKIESIDYVSVKADPNTVGTLCIITMKNGWVSTGFSAPASPENFDPEIGKHYAYQKAFEPLWQLEGYLLKESLHRG